MKVVSFLVSYHVTCAGENSTPFSFFKVASKPNTEEPNLLSARNFTRSYNLSLMLASSCPFLLFFFL
jgi:hypothetical protein